MHGPMNVKKTIIILQNSGLSSLEAPISSHVFIKSNVR